MKLLRVVCEYDSAVDTVFAKTRCPSETIAFQGNLTAELGSSEQLSDRLGINKNGGEGKGKSPREIAF